MNLRNLGNLDKNEILSLLGVETKPTTVGWITGTLGTFGVGLLVGAGLGLVLAPKPGRELRGSIRNRLSHVPEDLGVAMHEVTGRDRAPTAPHNNKT